MNPFLVMQLKVVHSALAAALNAIDMVLVSEELEQKEQAESARTFDPDPEKCEHPKSHWQQVPAMGNPYRVQCRCGKEMEITQ
jgi:hypothetical protein